MKFFYKNFIKSFNYLIMNGKNLKEKIKMCGFSLRDVANSLKISEQNLQNKLNVDDVKVSFLLDLSKILHKDINYLLDTPQYSEKSVHQLVVGDNNNGNQLIGNNIKNGQLAGGNIANGLSQTQPEINDLKRRLVAKDKVIAEKDALISNLIKQQETFLNLISGNINVASKAYSEAASRLNPFGESAQRGAGATSAT